MSKFSENFFRGGKSTQQDWVDHLIEAHDQEPTMSPDAFAGYKTTEGLNSYQVLANEIDFANSKKILDLACGDGHFSEYVLPRLRPDGELIGVDMAARG